MPAVDVLILGAGAAGLFCGSEAAKRGRSVVVVDHARKIAEKIRISGGGRCNFTNLHTTADNFLSANPRFARSALARYTPQDFVALVERHRISYHEKTQGQLFCIGSSQQIIDLLLAECRRSSVTIRTQTHVSGIQKQADHFVVEMNGEIYQAQSLVVATGGLSVPKIGATGLGYDIARQFDLSIVPTRPALVPLRFAAPDQADWSELTGVSLPTAVNCGRQQFREASLFTHRGLSGPAILQISSYWSFSTSVRVNLAPEVNAAEFLRRSKSERPQGELAPTLSHLLPRRLAFAVAHHHANGNASARISSVADRLLNKIGEHINGWTFVPEDTEGYRIAEVTAGGVNTDELSSQTMECKKVKGLFFIGEVVDVTGHLGGFNFQWAWASAFAAGQVA